MTRNLESKIVAYICRSCFAITFFVEHLGDAWGFPWDCALILPEISFRRRGAYTINSLETLNR